MAQQRHPHPICTKTFKLNNGTSFPAVGLGTWQGQFGAGDAEKLRSSIVHALQSGYRHIDTAQYYGVEKEVGEGIRASGIPRKDIIVTTKFWGYWHHDPGEALRQSLADLDIGYVDIFLMHWPCAMTFDEKPLRPDAKPTFVETWRMMEQLVGPQCRAIGVSNFTQKTLTRLLEETKTVPAINQVELHAFNPNLKLVPWCQARGIHVVSWSTMGGERETGSNELLTHPLFTQMASKYDCSAGVISLSWAVQRGVSVIPKSASPTRLESNIRLVTLSEAEMQAIDEAHLKIQSFRIADHIPAISGELADGTHTVMGWTRQDFGWEDDEGNWLT